MLKKFISALLAVVIVTSTFTTMTVSATEQNPASLTNNDVSVQGENSFGDMLSGKIEDAMAQETTSADFALSGLKIEDKTATVEYMSAVDCTILVALYDEATNKMVASGKSVVSSEEDVATITIETEEMPKYFVATAYMLDSNNAPLTDEFTTELYTEEIQMVKAMKATDFDEERVLKLEDTDETNFAVYSEDTKVIEYKENYNIPVTVDDENGIYVFSNANDDLKTLVKGDMLAYEYSADNIIILKVDTIKIDGDTVTITEGDAELEDVFDYVKIEARQDTSDCEFDMNGIDEDVRLVDDGSGVSSKASDSVGAVEGDITFEPNDLKLQLMGDTEGKNIAVTGDIGFVAKATLDFYISLKKFHVNFEFEYGFDYTIALTVKTKDTVEIPIVNVYIVPVTGVLISFTPTVVFEAETSISLSMSFGGSFGFQASNKGVKGIFNPPETSAGLKAEGEMFIGLMIEPQLSIVSKKIFAVGLPVTGGICVEAGIRDAEAHEDKDKGINHLCKICFEGNLSAKISVESEINLFKKEIGSISATLKKDLFSFYYSADFNEVGKGDCPHSEYSGCPVDIYVTRNGKPYPFAEVWVYGGTYAKMEGLTDENGKLTVHLPYGLYTADVDGELVSFLAHKSTKKVEINVISLDEPIPTAPKPTESTTTNPNDFEIEVTLPVETKPYIVDSGACGDNATWEYWNTGELYISGSGDMYNYTAGTAPWYDFVSFASEVSIDYGITSIGNGAFYGMSTEEIVLPVTIKMIGEYAFAYCNNFKEISIPKNIETIGCGAFAGCTALNTVYFKATNCTEMGDEQNPVFGSCYSLENVVFENTVKSIPDYAFCGCTSINNVEMSDSLTSIGYYAFKDCVSLTTIDITVNVESVDDSFYGCDNLSTINYYTNNYLGFMSDLSSLKTVNFYNNVPDRILSFCDSVTEVNVCHGAKCIGERAFEYCMSLTKINIEDSVTSIGEGAFYRCYYLVDVNLSDNITVIENTTFSYCSSLAEITLPYGVTRIGEDAFEYCENLVEINIPNSVNNIESGAFLHCISLPEIDIPDSVVIIGEWAFYDCYGLVKVNLSNNIKVIENSVFNGCSSLKEITIPYGVTSIGYNAFFVCTSLNKVIIPNSVNSIGVSAFQCCRSLVEVSIPNSVKEILNSAFEDCTSLKKIIMPNCITDIGTAMFSGCSNLTDINIPDSVTNIGAGAFGGCTSLSEIRLPKNLTHIGRAAFFNCTALNDIHMPNNTDINIDDCAFVNCTSLTELNIPDNVTHIGEEAFRDCVNLTKINIPKGIWRLEHSIFSGCQSLKEITIPNNIIEIGWQAFEGCTSLTEVRIPNSVTTIESEAFYECRGLLNISISDSVTSIGRYAFAACDSLDEISLPSNLNSIEEGLLYWCDSLLQVNIPDGVQYIGSKAFSDCKNLTEITLPYGVTRIGAYAFEYCENLVEINIPNSVNDIGYHAFLHCISLPEIDIPDSVIDIGWGAFSYCKNLKKVNIPKGVTNIASDMFGGCGRLAEIIIPSNVTSIGRSAFSECWSLKEIIIPNSVISIESYAFSGCTNLNEIIIPNSVRSIGDRAFGDTGITDVYIYGNPELGYSVFPSYTEIHYMNDESTESASTSYTTSNLINNSSANVAKFDNLIAGGDYIVAVVKSEGAEDLLSADNLLYIEQVTADESGKASLEYVPRESVENPVVLIFGAERMSISDVEVTALKDEGTQAVKYTVTLNGALLTENTDYELVADGESVTINGINNYKDSITLTIVPMLIGDVNLDNTININDTTYIMKYLAELESCNDKQKLIADTNGDGAVTITDATQIQKYLASLITSFN